MQREKIAIFTAVKDNVGSNIHVSYFAANSGKMYFGTQGITDI